MGDVGERVASLGIKRWMRRNAGCRGRARGRGRAREGWTRDLTSSPYMRSSLRSSMRRSSSSFALKLLIGPAAFSVSRVMIQTSRFIGAPETFLLTARVRPRGPATSTRAPPPRVRAPRSRDDETVA